MVNWPTARLTWQLPLRLRVKLESTWILPKDHLRSKFLTTTKPQVPQLQDPAVRLRHGANRQSGGAVTGTEM